MKKILDKLKWLDPFTYVDLYLMPKVNPKNSEIISLIVYVVFAFLFAFIIYNLLGFLLGTSSPMVIVVSTSMEPVLFRGDVVIISGVNGKDIKAESVDLDLSLVDSLPFKDYAKTYCTPIGMEKEIECKLLPKSCPAVYNTTSIEFENQKVPVNTSGDIIVYHSNTLFEPIIHRVVTKINARDGIYLLTKGDSSCNADIDQVIGISRGAINAEDIEGKALIWIPKIGCIKLWVFDDLFSLLLTGKLPKNFSGIC